MTRYRQRCSILAMLAGALLTAGCQTITDSYYDWFGMPDKAAKLVDFNPTASVQVLWKVSAGAAKPYVFSPAVIGDSVYAASSDGDVTAIEAGSGAKLWEADTKRKLSGGIGALADYLLVGTNKGEVIALDASGQERWIAQVSSEVLAPPQVTPGGLVVVRSGDGRIFGLDAANGKRRWVYERSTPALTVRSFAGVALFPGGVFAGFPGGKLVALNETNGALGWEATVAQPRGATELERVADVTSLPVIDYRQICAAAYQGRVACFDIQRGTPVWARDISSISGIAVDGSMLLITDDRGAVIALDKNSGSSLWKQDKLLDRRVSAPLAYGDYVVVGDYKGYVHVLRREDGAFAARLATDGSAIVATPVALPRGFLVQTLKGGLHAIHVE